MSDATNAKAEVWAEIRASVQENWEAHCCAIGLNVEKKVVRVAAFNLQRQACLEAAKQRFPDDEIVILSVGGSVPLGQTYREATTFFENHGVPADECGPLLIAIINEIVAALRHEEKKSGIYERN